MEFSSFLSTTDYVIYKRRKECRLTINIELNDNLIHSYTQERNAKGNCEKVNGSIVRQKG